MKKLENNENMLFIISELKLTKVYRVNFKTMDTKMLLWVYKRTGRARKTVKTFISGIPHLQGERKQKFTSRKQWEDESESYCNKADRGKHPLKGKAENKWPVKMQMKANDTF